MNWFTPKQAAEYLQIAQSTILSRARSGRLKGYTLSGTERHIWRFKQEDLDAMMQSPAVPTEGRVN